MPRITNYLLVRDLSYDTLTERVNSLISDGWQPFGSPSSSACYDSDEGDISRAYTQALVKYAERAQ